MEPYIPISMLNDFIFCPRSIYFHQVHGGMEQDMYHTEVQIEGKAAHQSIEYTGWLLQEIMKYKKDMFVYVQKYYRAFMKEKPIKDYPEFLIKE
jgi:CRISPR/Cas system-associated exonuclease Cas4 (RecB family)